MSPLSFVYNKQMSGHQAFSNFSVFVIIFHYNYQYFKSIINPNFLAVVRGGWRKIGAQTGKIGGYE